VDNGAHERGGDPLAAERRKEVEVAEPPHAGVIDVRVEVETAHTGQRSRRRASREQRLAALIEPVRAIAPPVAQHGDGAEAFPQALLDQTVEVEREFGHWVHRG